MTSAKKRMGFFEKYLTLWVAICIAVGIGIGDFAGDSIRGLSNMEIYKVNITVAISLFGLQSPAALVTVVGILVEVPVMLSLVALANRWKY